MVVARTRAEAEDAAERVQIEWQELPAVTDKKTALDPGTPAIHAELGDNLAFRKTIDTGDVDAAFAKADLVIEDTFEFGRHTAVSLESRALLAAYDKRTRQAHHHHQQPVPAHDPARVRAHAGRARPQGADHRPRRRRLVRAQDPHLRRRGGGRGGGDRAGPPRQVHRRPAGVVRVRHPRAREFRQGAHRREQVRRDPGLRHRRAVGRRRLFAISAHQRVRGHPGPQHHGRALPAQALPRRAPPWSISTSRRPRSIAPSAIRSATRWASTWSIAPRPRSASTRSRCAAATSCPTTPIPAVSASGIKLKDLSHQRCIDVLVERMDYAELRAGAGAAARRRASIAASASPASSRAPRRGRTATTAPAARRSRCRMPASSSSSPTAASSARWA